MDPTTRFQPSIITNSSTLNGSDTMAGGSCIMPIESSVVGVSYPGANWIVKGDGNKTNGWINLVMRQ